MAAGAVITWWWPEYLETGIWKEHLGAIALFEFLVLHSVAMLAGLLMLRHKQKSEAGTSWKKWLPLSGAIGLGGFYLLMAYVVATESDSYSLFIGFLALIISRLIGFLGEINPKVVMRDMFRSFFSLFLFMTGIFVAAYVPFPAGAVQGEWMNESTPVEGMLAVIALYYFLLGYYELKVPAELPDRFVK